MTPVSLAPIIQVMQIRIGVSAALVAATVAAGSAALLAQQAPQDQQAQGVIAGDPAKGAALLADARKALGGDDKLRALKTLQLKGSFRRTAGNNQVEGDLEILIEPPDKMKRTEDTSAPGGGPATLNIQALNGTEIWDENTGGAAGRFGGFGGGGFGGGGRGGFGGGGGGGRGGFGGGGAIGGGNRGGQDGQAPAVGADGQRGGRANIDPEQLRQLQLRQRQADFSRLMLVLLLSTDAPATWIGTAQSPDGTADVLEVRPADGNAATRLFLDSASHMPLMITWQGGPQGGFNRGGGGRRGAAGAPGAPQGGDQAAAPAPPPPGDQAAAPQGGAPSQAQGGGRRGGGGQPVTLRMTMGDYRTVNGLKLPHSITRGAGGQTTEEWTVSSYRLNQAFKANTFEQKK